MDKLKMMSTNGVDLNIKKLESIFPECVTESIVNGELKKSVDMDILNSLISNENLHKGGGRKVFIHMAW